MAKIAAIVKKYGEKGPIWIYTIYFLKPDGNKILVNKI